ncbi:MAG TPA: 50S ribosomal protein L20 [candidate division Zixibacteria bacterium]|nr:50S ribosomal protein L20 [candidate division Zixibacteria bacterium]
MPRSRGTVASHARRRKYVKAASGYFGSRHRLYRTSREVVERAWTFQYKHRKTKKRDFRRLWIARINAAARLEGMTYSNLIHGLKKAEVLLDRKSLAYLAIHDPAAFSKIAEVAKNSL